LYIKTQTPHIKKTPFLITLFAFQLLTKIQKEDIRGSPKNQRRKTPKMANKHILFYLLFLILLLNPSANSIGVNLKVTPEELAAVKGDISAVYIMRVIQERAEALKILKNKCSSTLPDEPRIKYHILMLWKNKLKILKRRNHMETACIGC
jgi:hypothetical protein